MFSKKSVCVIIMLACVIFITSNVNLVFAADAENYSFEAEPFVNLPEISPEGFIMIR